MPVVKLESDYQHPPAAFPIADEAPKKSLSRSKKLLIAAVIALVVLAVVLGATLGVVLPRQSSSTTVVLESGTPAPPPTETTPGTGPSAAVLGNSNIAAFSSIDDFRNTINGVFFQDPSGALMFSMWNSSTKAWNVTSISAEMNAQGEPINLKKGSPLAVDYPDDPLAGQWGTFTNVRFVNAGNNHQYAHQWWGKEGGWVPWSVRTTAFYGWDTPAITDGSQISAVFTGCSRGCRRGSLVLYQDSNQNAVTLYDTYGQSSWTKANLGSWIGARLVPNRAGSMVVFKYMPPGSNATGPPGLRAYIDVSGRLQEYDYDASETFASSNSWTTGTNSWPLSDAGSGPYVPPRIAGTSWTGQLASGDQPRENILLTLLYNNGTAVMRWRTASQRAWSMGIAPVTNVSALAVTSSMRAYCIRNGKVEEYSMSTDQPDKWDLVGEVPLTVG